ncbi:hypothetical protein AA2016_6346 (plasmid) [Aminobacter aminovorans]|uniref:Integrase catalytic domain-containing protein n=1 Tax=Aminobacter aminovorans TaxID=83263 RepID=A0AAC9ATY3_AMIAI|nr:hypothetical protein AA2016_6346 [Aminobacter aminovorans]
MFRIMPPDDLAPIGRGGIEQLLVVIKDENDPRVPPDARLCHGMLEAQLMVVRAQILESSGTEKLGSISKPDSSGRRYGGHPLRRATHGARRMARAAAGTAHNGKAERFIQTSLREWAYVRPYASSNERTKAIHQWADNYNLARPHSALGGISPFRRLNNILGNDI